MMVNKQWPLKKHLRMSEQHNKPPTPMVRSYSLSILVFFPHTSFFNSQFFILGSIYLYSANSRAQQDHLLNP
jgi:hypothetical protein